MSSGPLQQAAPGIFDGFRVARCLWSLRCDSSGKFPEFPESLADIDRVDVPERELPLALPERQLAAADAAHEFRNLSTTKGLLDLEVPIVRRHGHLGCVKFCRCDPVHRATDLGERLDHGVLEQA